MRVDSPPFWHVQKTYVIDFEHLLGFVFKSNYREQSRSWAPRVWSMVGA